MAMAIEVKADGKDSTGTHNLPWTDAKGIHHPPDLDSSPVQPSQKEESQQAPLPGPSAEPDRLPSDGTYPATIHASRLEDGLNLSFEVETSEGKWLVDWFANLNLPKARNLLSAARRAAGLMSTADDLELEGKQVKVFCQTVIVQGIPKLRIQKVFALGTVGPASPSDTPPTVTAAIRPFSEIAPQKVEWLWQGRIPMGKPTLLIGDPGVGKSLVEIDAAARVSTGHPWPDGAPCESGNVLILSAEDDPNDTLRPRLDAAGADVRNVYIIDAIRRVTEKGKTMTLPFNLATDLAALAEQVERIGNVRLIVIDPISAYLGSSDSHVNAQVRALLTPLAELAAKHKVAIMAITHLSKGQGAAIYRAIGSIAFVAAARAAWLFAKDTHDPHRRLMLPLKNNLAADSNGMAYRIEAAGLSVKINWEPDPVTLQADEVLNLDPNEKPSQRQEAAEFIQAALVGGPRPANELIGEARSAGISEGTLKRARAQLGVVANKAGFKDGWYWSLPTDETTEEAQPHQAPANQEAQHTESEPLRQDDHKEDKQTQQLNRRSSTDKEVSPFAGVKGPEEAREEVHNGESGPLRASDCKEGVLPDQEGRRSSPGGDEPPRSEETGPSLPPEAAHGHALTPEPAGRQSPERPAIDMRQSKDGTFEVDL